MQDGNSRAMVHLVLGSLACVTNNHHHSLVDLNQAEPCPIYQVTTLGYSLSDQWKKLHRKCFSKPVMAVYI